MKRAFRVTFVSVIVLIMFNVIAFAIPFTKGRTFWISYSFALISIFVTIYVSASANSVKKPLRSRFYGWQLITVSAIYLAIQLIISIIFMSIPMVPSWASLSVGIVLLGFCLLGLLAGSVDNCAAERLDVLAATKVEFLKTLQSDLQSVISNCSDLDLRNRIKRLEEDIRYSDPMSSPSLIYIENNIRAKCLEIRTAVVDGNFDKARFACEEAISLLEERNKLCLRTK